MKEEEHPNVFYNARWYGYFGLLIGLCFLSMGVFGLVSQRIDGISILCLLTISSIFIWLGWRTATDDKPVLKFGRNGIWTRKLGAITWQQGTLKYTTVLNPKSGSIESLFILNKATQQRLDWVSLTSISGSTEKIKERLASCKKAQII